MKKHLIAVLLTACLLFSFGTTAFADPSGEQTLDTGSAGGNVTQNSTEQGDEGKPEPHVFFFLLYYVCVIFVFWTIFVS